MSQFYTGLQETADRLLRAYGRSILLKITNKSSYNPSTGAIAETHTEHTVQVAILPNVLKLADKYQNEYAEGDVLLRTSRKFILSAKDLTGEPTCGDILVFDGYDWNIFGISPINPAGTSLLYSGAVSR